MPKTEGGIIVLGKVDIVCILSEIATQPGGNMMETQVQEMKQDQMKLAINVVLVLVFALITIMLGLVWVNNLKASIDWHSLPANEKPSLITDSVKKVETAEVDSNAETAEVDSNAEKVKEKEIHGFTEKLDWTLVDYSTATTFIFFYGFALITRGLFRVGRNRQNLIGKGFPFTVESDMIIVTLGLVGTLWGLIMIGYYDVNNIQMPQLMICMKTALWSSLVALIWAYILQPSVIVPSIRYWNIQLNGLQTVNEAEEADLEDLLSKFGLALSKVTGLLAGFTSSLASVRTDFSSLSEEARKALVEISGFITKTVNPLYEQLKELMKELKKSSESNTRACDAIAENAKKQNEIASKQFEAIKLLIDNLAQAHSEVSTLQVQNKDCQAQVVALQSEIAMLRQAMEVIRERTNFLSKNKK